MRTPCTSRPTALSIGLLLGIVTFVTLYPGLARVGLTWDEYPYFQSVERIQTWTADLVRGPDRSSLLREDAIRESWDWWRYRNLHPPAYKMAMAATEGAFGDRVGSVVGYRMAPLLAFSLLVASVSVVAGLAWGGTAAMGAGLSLLFMPRVAGHAHVGATDMILSLSWFLALAGLAGFVRGGRSRSLILGGAALGVGLATKFTAYLLPLAVLPWCLVFGRSRRAAMGYLAWGLGGLVVWWLINPLAWHDPLIETIRVFAESLKREGYAPIATYYLGQVWDFSAPWHYALVMTAVTVPVGVLTLAGVGSLRPAKERAADPLIWLAISQVAFFFVLLATRTSPNHDGVRLFLPLFPFLALLAGRGFHRVVRLVAVRLPDMGGRRATAAAGLAAAVFLVPAALQTVTVSPFHLSYYNELLGGPRGAAEAGMEATYWLEAVNPEMIGRINSLLPAGATLAVHPNPEHFHFLQELGLLRADLSFEQAVVAPAEDDRYLLLVARKAMFEPWHHRLYEEGLPSIETRLDGVLLAALYEPGVLSLLGITASP